MAIMLGSETLNYASNTMHVCERQRNQKRQPEIRTASSDRAMSGNLTHRVSAGAAGSKSSLTMPAALGTWQPAPDRSSRFSHGQAALRLRSRLAIIASHSFFASYIPDLYRLAAASCASTATWHKFARRP